MASLDARVFREIVEGVQDPLLVGHSLHLETVAQTRAPGNAAKPDDLVHVPQEAPGPRSRSVAAAFARKKQVGGLPEGLRPAFNRALDLQEGLSPGPRSRRRFPPYPPAWLQAGHPASRNVEERVCARRRRLLERRLAGPRRDSARPGSSLARIEPDPASHPNPAQLGVLVFGSALGSVAAAGAGRCAAAAASRWFTMGSNATRADSAVAGSSCSTEPTTLLA